MQREYGDLILQWFQSGFQSRGALHFYNLYLYGGLFDLPAQWFIATGIAPWGPYETRHVLTAIVAVAGVLATYGVGARIGGKLAGVLAALSLALTPTWVGHGWFNPKDIPFGTATAIVAYVSVRIAMDRSPLSPRTALLVGLSVGAGLGIRPGGMFLFLFPGLAALGRCALIVVAQRQQTCRPTRFGPLLGRTSAALAGSFVLAWLVMIATWPWALRRPFTRPFLAAREAAHFPWQSEVLFKGELVRPEDLPLSYLPEWFRITIPELYVCGFLAGAASLLWHVRGRRPRLERLLSMLVLAAFVVVPFVGVVLSRPNLYDGHRHFLFFWPPLAAISGIGLAHALRNRAWPIWLRTGTGGVWLALAALVLVDMVELHPFEYVYFNRMSGGLAAAAGQFDTDYWGSSYREGLAWVVESGRVRSRRGRKLIRVAGCDSWANERLDYYLQQWPSVSERFVVAASGERPDVYLGITRFGCHRSRGRVVHRVERQGTPLLFVYQR